MLSVYINTIINYRLLILVLLSLCKILLVIVPMLLAVAYLTLLERKAMAAIQRRRGPSVVGIFGFLQPFADGLKLFCKEINTYQS